MDTPLALCSAFLLGALFGPEWPIAAWTAGTLVLVAWGLRGSRTLLPAASLAAFGIGILASGFAPPPAEPRTEASGRILSVQQYRAASRILVEQGDGTVIDVRTNTIAYVVPGDVRRFSGSAHRPRDFAEIQRMALGGIDGRIDRARVGPREGFIAPPILERLRASAERRMLRMHPGDPGALLAGLLTGSRAGVSDDAAAALRTSGLSHIVAISGANFALIIALLTSALSFAAPKVRAILIASGTVLFWCFVDGGSAVARAAITALLGVAASLGGRRLPALRGLLFAATMLACTHPLRARADVGLQLSVLATLGVLRASGNEEGILGWKSTLRASLWTTSATLPVQLGVFGQLPLYAPLANVLALPLVPLAMGVGLAEFLLGWIPGIGFVLHEASSLVLGGILGIAGHVAQLPGAATELPSLPTLLQAPLLALWGSMFCWVVLRNRRSVEEGWKPAPEHATVAAHHPSSHGSKDAPPLHPRRRAHPPTQYEEPAQLREGWKARRREDSRAEGAAVRVPEIRN